MPALTLHEADPGHHLQVKKTENIKQPKQITLKKQQIGKKQIHLFKQSNNIFICVCNNTTFLTRNIATCTLFHNEFCFW